MYARRGLGALPASAYGAAAGTVLPGVGTVLGGAAGALVGGIFSGHHYTGPHFVPDGVVAWASQGHWDWIQQVADSGYGHHWSENRMTNYDLSSAGDVGAYGSIPGNIPLGQWLHLFLQTYGPHAATADPVTGAAVYQPTVPDTAFHPGAAAPVAQPGLPPSQQAPAGAGFSPLLGLGIGAAAIAAVFMATGGKRRQNPLHRHLLPKYTGYSQNRRHRRRSHRRRSGRRRR